MAIPARGEELATILYVREDRDSAGIIAIVAFLRVLYI